MTACAHCSKTSLANQKSGRKEKLSERDRHVLKGIVTSKKGRSEAKVTNQHRDSPVSTITVRRHLHKQNIYCKAAFPKYFFAVVGYLNAKNRLQRCHTRKPWSSDKWKKVIYSDESSLSHISQQQDGCTFEEQHVEEYDVQAYVIVRRQCSPSNCQIWRWI
ncbi:hypothetical protein TNCV_1012271 [Trichonephila clavipes]|uniref:Transposase Tc1-like domain-containing protein n=1 Tax=Trichonephila clavipes TaxID=2585209 RepID=A0A8X6VXD6_TRICX|nr:hypothetical protein TNCV_1012271 [Trichonephila clavipes]